MSENGQQMTVVHEKAGELAMPVQEVKTQIQQIQRLMKDCMKDGQHFGKVPGTDKPTLLKPGAEKLCLMFRLDPQYETKELMSGDHLTVISTCTLYHITAGQRMGSGMGSCSTKESKYAYRNSNRKCPKCGKESIIKGKSEFGGGYLCFKKKDGCGAKFTANDAAITSQPAGKVANDQLADQYNTVLKMANKRSLVAAVLNVTAASDIFTQDLEDLPRANTPKETPQEAVDTSTGEIMGPEGDLPESDDGDAVEPEVMTQEAGPVITEKQKKRFFAIAFSSKKGTPTINAYLKSVGIPSADAIPQNRYEEVVAWAEGKAVAQ